MSENNTTTPWWKQPKNITWMGIIAVFLIAATILAFGLRGTLQPSEPTDGYIDVQEIEELIEVDADNAITIDPAILEAGYVVPKFGPFCDDDGNVISEWERIQIEYDMDYLNDGNFTGNRSFHTDTDAPFWFTQATNFRIVKVITPVVDISALAIDGTENGYEATEVVDLTKYTDPATQVIFVDGCEFLPPATFSRAFDLEGPPFLQRINPDGTVNVAQIYYQDRWMEDEKQGVQYSAVSENPNVISDELGTQSFPLYYPVMGSASKESMQYYWFDFGDQEGIRVFRGDDRDELWVRTKTAPPAGKSVKVEYFPNAVEIPFSDGIDPVELYENGFCFGDYKEDLTVTRIINPDPSLLPEGFTSDLYITDNYYDSRGSNQNYGPCYWLHATIIDQ